MKEKMKEKKNRKEKTWKNKEGCLFKLMTLKTLLLLQSEIVCSPVAFFPLKPFYLRANFRMKRLGISLSSFSLLHCLNSFGKYTI